MERRSRFSGAKCHDDGDKIKYTKQENPLIAKQIGRRERGLPANWDDIAYDTMNEVLHVKFSNPELAEKLLATGDAYLEEGNTWHDNRWGNCTCEKCRAIDAQNWLGKILMGIRTDYNRTVKTH